jgi:hypothetical protein
MGRGRDIVMGRHALFPETLLDEDESSFNEDDRNIDNVEDDLDALLATLGGWNTDEDKRTDSSSGSDDKILELTTQLQDWRAKQVKTPYEKWSDDERKDFKVCNIL